jgi:hypothetical protein
MAKTNKKEEDEIEGLEDLPQTDLNAMLAEDTEKSELDKLMARMMDPANIHHNTDVSQEEINGFSTLYAMHRDFKSRGYKIDILEKWLLEQLKLRVSRGRAGRKEWVKITTKMQEDTARKGGFLDYFRRD